MKTVLGLALISTCAFAIPAWAHSICQYQSDEAHCSEYPECVWEVNADSLGYCVYERNIPESADSGRSQEVDKLNDQQAAVQLVPSTATTLRDAGDRRYHRSL